MTAADILGPAVIILLFAACAAFDRWMCGPAEPPCPAEPPPCDGANCPDGRCYCGKFYGDLD